MTDRGAGRQIPDPYGPVVAARDRDGTPIELRHGDGVDWATMAI
jgi:hypothetical protein